MKPRYIAVIGTVALLIVGTVLFFFNPEQTPWVPQCLFHWLTGWDCPACGTQRAFHCLLHGQFCKALGYNVFMILSIPYAVALAGVMWFVPPHRCVRLRNFLSSSTVVGIYLILMVLWWLLRNLLNVL